MSMTKEVYDPTKKILLRNFEHQAMPKNDKMFNRNLLTPKKGSTKAKNELRKRKKIIEARFDTVLQV